MNPIITSPSGIQRGDITHHQLQFATTPTSANFSIKNTRNNAPKKPIPPDDELDSLDMVFIFTRIQLCA